MTDGALRCSWQRYCHTLSKIIDAPSASTFGHAPVLRHRGATGGERMDIMANSSQRKVPPDTVLDPNVRPPYRHPIPDRCRNSFHAAARAHDNPVPRRAGSGDSGGCGPMYISGNRRCHCNNSATAIRRALFLIFFDTHQQS